jgi:hypothetical protein
MIVQVEFMNQVAIELMFVRFTSVATTYTTLHYTTLHFTTPLTIPHKVQSTEQTKCRENIAAATDTCDKQKKKKLRGLSS